MKKNKKHDIVRRSSWFTSGFVAVDNIYILYIDFRFRLITASLCSRVVSMSHFVLQWNSMENRCSVFALFFTDLVTKFKQIVHHKHLPEVNLVSFLFLITLGILDYITNAKDSSYGLYVLFFCDVYSKRFSLFFTMMPLHESQTFSESD